MEQRVERLSRALQLFQSNQAGVLTFFDSLERGLVTNINGAEKSLQIAVSSSQMDTIARVQRELDELKGDLRLIRKQRKNVCNMMYETARDAYNSGVPNPAQQIDPILQ